MQDKLQEEVAAHQHTSEALTQRIYMEARAEQKILEMREEAKKQKQWFEDQLASRSELAKETEQRLKDEIHHLEDIHAREATL